MNVLAFDIETVPDVELGRRLYDLDGLDDAAVAQAMFAKQRAIKGSDFLPAPQQRVVAISVVLRTREGLKIFSLGDEQSQERELVQRRRPVGDERDALTRRVVEPEQRDTKDRAGRGA